MLFLRGCGASSFVAAGRGCGLGSGIGAVAPLHEGLGGAVRGRGDFVVEDAVAGGKKWRCADRC